MSSLKILWVSVVMGVLLVMQGCQGEQSPTAADIADGFWAAYLGGNTQKARAYLADPTVPGVRYAGEPSDFHRLVRGRMEGDAAIIETEIVFVREGREYAVPLDTVLLQTGRGWRVDFEQTVNSVFSRTMQAAYNLVTAGWAHGAIAFQRELPVTEGKANSELADTAKELSARFTRSILDTSLTLRSVLEKR